MRWIYISPHLDDAILSCGGLIHEQTRRGTAVEIWTICAGEAPPGELSPLAQVCHFQWGTQTAGETLTLRRAEDVSAAAAAGALTRHLHIPDCIYRRSPQGDLLYTEGVFVPRHPLEADLDREIATLLEGLLEPGDTLVSPLSIGGHIDHVLVREAVEHLPCPRRYYADIPYLLNHPESLEPLTGNLQAELFQVSEPGVQAWQDGIAAYRSQIQMLFETEEMMRSAIRLYWEKESGVCLWHHASSDSS